MQGNTKMFVLHMFFKQNYIEPINNHIDSVKIWLNKN